MIAIRKAADRGHARHGWLESFHTFSFASYHDPRFMGFRDLRVINEDRVAPGQGFGAHGHRDMEIVTYVVEGALEHRDSLGHGSIIRPGDVQRMSAGRGITHSEFNAHGDELLHFLQIWILPARHGGEPSYEQRHFGEAERRNRLRCVVSPDGGDGSLRIDQDVAIHAARLDTDSSVTHRLAPDRHAWIQLVRGRLDLEADGTIASLEPGDGVAVTDSEAIALRADQPAEVLLFDLA